MSTLQGLLSILVVTQAHTWLWVPEDKCPGLSLLKNDTPSYPFGLSPVMQDTVWDWVLESQLLYWVKLGSGGCIPLCSCGGLSVSSQE